MNFFSNLDTPLDFFAFILVLAVVFVNGFTDAPSSVHASVKAGALSLRCASLLSGAFNFFGVITSSFFLFSVGESVYELADTKNANYVNIIVCACLLTVILVGILAWIFKMPSSESHALLFSLIGANFCMNESSKASPKSIVFIILGMFFSSLLAYIFSHIFTKLLTLRARKNHLILSCCALSFMHGAQDGQKLLAVLLMLQGVGTGISSPPLVCALLVGGIMCISTVLCGKRILSSIDKLSEKSDTGGTFSSDLSTFLTLFISSIIGLPVSTGNVKSAAVFGTDKKHDKESKRVITKIFLTSVITLPISFLLGFLICKLMLIFVN